VLGEHRLERCLTAADRVVAMEAGRIAYDGDPAAFLGWALRSDPALATPVARLFSEAGLRPPTGVREARRMLTARGAAGPAADAEEETRPEPARPPGAAVQVRDLWVALGERGERVDALRGLDLSVAPGERVALMGRNGAGKSTLLRAAAGLLPPNRGRVSAPDGAALLPQRPDDLIVRELVGEELPGDRGRAALELFGLTSFAGSDPRDLSGGERQRLALAIVSAGRGGGSGSPPGAVLLDEPTRGMDRARKSELAKLATRLADAGAAVVIATHDVEFASEFATRIVLLGRGEVVADGPPAELLAGGWYFSTEVARVLDGRAVTPDQGVPVLRAALDAAAATSGGIA
jgi:energy-coupling factor transport system ATP-binding protein